MPGPTPPAPPAESRDTAAAVSPPQLPDAYPPITSGAGDPHTTSDASAAGDPERAIHEVAGGDLRERWLATAGPAPTVTYVAALPPTGRRGRSSSHVPGSTWSSASPPRPPAAPAPRRSVTQTVVRLWACVRRVGGRRLPLLVVPAMLLALLPAAFLLGSGYGGAANAPLVAPLPAATAALPPAAAVPAATEPAATEQVGAAAASTAGAVAPVIAPPVRVAVRLSCNDDANALGMGLDLATVEVIAAGINRCAGWHLVQADTVVSWVPSGTLPGGATSSPASPGDER